MAAPTTSAAAATDQDWPTFLQNVSRTAATTDANLAISNAALLKRKWAFATGGPIATSASIVGTTAYIGSWDGYEYAVNTGTGTLIWKRFLGITDYPPCFPARLGVTSAATVVNGVVYVGGGDHYWYALNASTGAVLWRVYVGGTDRTDAHYNWASPLVVNGAAYIGIASNCDNPLVHGELLKVDIATHQVVATYDFVPLDQVGGGVWTTPAYDASTKTVFVSTGTINDYTQTDSMAIIALDATTLQRKSSWQLPFSAAVFDSDWGTSTTLTTGANGRKLLSVANKNGVVYTFDRNNLAAGPVWQQRIAIGGDCPICGDGTIASGSFANGVLYYAGAKAVFNGRGSAGSISALDAGTGQILWTRQTDGSVFGSPAYVNGMIAEAAGSTFEVLNASTGALLYSYDLPDIAYGAVSVSRGQFYVGALDGTLYAFGLGTVPPAPPTDLRCPSGFTCRDIGTSGGSEQTTSGTLTVTAKGAKIGGPLDQFRFISKSVTGDAQSSVRIVAQSTQNTRPQAGLIVRQRYGTSTDPDAPYFAVLASPKNTAAGIAQPQLVISYRSRFGQNAVELATRSPAIPPVSVMIQRTGNLFSAGVSSDGVNFQRVPGTSVFVDLPATTVQGLAVNSGASGNAGTASFRNLSIGGAVTTPMTAPPAAHPCPTNWICADVGNPAPVGDTTSAGSAIALAGTGTGIGGARDSMHFVYRSVSGNWTIAAQVTTAPTASNAQAGLVMRASAAPTAPMYAVTLNPGGTATVTWRLYDGIDSRATVPLPTITSPAYLSLDRYQDTRFNPPVTFFSASTSPDGTHWSPVLGSTVAIDMGTGSYLAGLAATTGTAGATTPATFDSVRFSVPGAPPPGVCPSEFTCTDIGTDGRPGNQVVDGNTWTMRASGGDIWGVYDVFRFAYDDFPSDPANSTNGDGTVSARVVSQTEVGGPWMKSGVMIRAGADPQAPYYGVFVTPNNGVAVQWRSTQAGATSSASLPATTAPIWLLASRYTDTARNLVYYSAFTSPDGVNFTFVPGSTVILNLPGPLIAGIAADSNYSGGTAVTTFEDVAQLPGSQPPPYICPSAWNCSDIGGALPRGQDQLTPNGTWNEIGGGGDIWATSDAFHYVWQPQAADGTVTAHITSQQPTDPWAKAGPMIRASTAPGSPYYAALVTPANGIVVQWRTATDATTKALPIAGAAPAYLRVGRFTTAGSNPQTFYTAYSSTDGATWTAVPGSTVPLDMTGALLAGFAITSHHDGVGSAVALDSVAVTAGGIPPPGICPIDWRCDDVGGATPPGTQSESAGAWTLSGGGGDIWNVADEFHFVSRPMAGDGVFSARVASQTNTDAWAKAGAMVRATTDEDAPYYAIFVSPTNGIVVQWRTAQGATTSQAGVAGGTPTYLRINRTGTTFSAATSADGGTWTTVPGSNISLPSLSGSLLAGMAVTSHDVNASSTVVMDSVVSTP